jgi:hypothetical protein
MMHRWQGRASPKAAAIPTVVETHPMYLRTTTTSTMVKLMLTFDVETLSNITMEQMIHEKNSKKHSGDSKVFYEFDDQGQEQMPLIFAVGRKKKNKAQSGNKNGMMWSNPYTGDTTNTNEGQKAAPPFHKGRKEREGEHESQKIQTKMYKYTNNGVNDGNPTTQIKQDTKRR